MAGVESICLFWQLLDAITEDQKVVVVWQAYTVIILIIKAFFFPVIC